MNIKHLSSKYSFQGVVVKVLQKGSIRIEGRPVKVVALFNRFPKFVIDPDQFIRGKCQGQKANIQLLLEYLSVFFILLEQNQQNCLSQAF